MGDAKSLSGFTKSTEHPSRGTQAKGVNDARSGPSGTSRAQKGLFLVESLPPALPRLLWGLHRAARRRSGT